MNSCTLRSDFRPVVRLVTLALLSGGWRPAPASTTFNDGTAHDITTPLAGPVFVANSPTTVNLLPGGSVNVTPNGPAGVSMSGGTINISGGSVIGGNHTGLGTEVSISAGTVNVNDGSIIGGNIT